MLSDQELIDGLCAELRQLRVGGDLLERLRTEAERDEVAIARSERRRPDTRPSRRRVAIGTWVSVGVSLAIVAAVIGIVVGVGHHARSTKSTPTLGQGRGGSRPVGIHAESVVNVGGDPQAVLVHGATLWVATPGRVVAFDLRTGRTLARIRYRGAPVGAGLAYGAGSLWLASTGSAGLVRIDPLTDRVIATISVGVKHNGTLRSLGGGVAFAADRVWISRDSNRPRGDVIAINPTTDKPDGAPITVRSGPDEVVAGFGSLWVDNTSAVIGNKAPGPVIPALSRIDAQTRRVRSLSFTGIPAVGFGSLWVLTDAGDASAALVRVDPTTDRTLTRIPVPRVRAVSFGDGRVWAVCDPKSRSASTFEPIKGTAALRQIDPSTNRVIGKPRYLQTLQPVAIAVSRDQLWIGDYQGRKLDHLQLARR